MILADWQIEELCSTDTPMISPFVGEQMRENSFGKVVSYGLSSYGYDIRLGGGGAKWLKPTYNGVVSPKHEQDQWEEEPILLEDADSKEPYYIVPPNSVILAPSLEHFIMPRDVVAQCGGKSTYARLGLFLNVTLLEAAWRGYLTLELSNLTPLPIMVYVNEGIAQLQFFRGEPCRVSYADRAGKYQDQAAEAVTARL